MLLQTSGHRVDAASAPASARHLQVRSSGRSSSADFLPMLSGTPLVVAGVAAALASGSAVAQSRPDATPGEMSTVVVTATRSESPLLEVPASATVVSHQELEARRVTRMGDALVEVPGLYVRGAALGWAYPGSGQAVLSLRGIPRTPRTLVMLDGLPLNNALSGGVNVGGIAMQNIERVEVVRGPYSALWGGHAMGGVINFISASPDNPIAELRGGLGSNNMRSGQAVLRQRFAGGLGISFSAGYRSSDGYDDAEYVVKTAPRARPANPVPVTGAIPTQTVSGAPAWWVGTRGARPWRQRDAQLAFDWKLGDGTTMATGLGWGEYDVGYSRPSSFLRGANGNPVFAGGVNAGGQALSIAPTDFLTATPSWERDLRAFVRVEHRFEGGSLLRVNLGRLEHRFDFGSAATAPGSNAGYDFGPGELTRQPNDRTDLDVSWRQTLAGHTVLTLGGALNRSNLDRTTWALSNWRNHDSRIAMNGRGEGTTTGKAVFAQTETMIGEKGRLVLGLRYDRYTTEGTIVDNVAGTSQSYPRNEFSRLSPKVAFAWQATNDLHLRASIGSGFRPPALLDLYSAFTVPVGITPILYDASPDLKPERVTAIDAGADFKLRSARGSVTIFAQKLDDLIYRRSVTPTLRRSENIGSARVDGIEADLRLPAGLAGLNAFASLTHNFRYEVTDNPAVPGSVGKKLTDVPRTMWSAGLDYRSGPWNGLLIYRHVSQVFGSADDLNQNTVQGVYEAYDSYGVASARVGYRFDRHWSASLAVDNITDKRYFVFARQPGRTVYGELAYRF